MQDKDAFQDWKFTHADFETIRLARNDFVYADPPYVVSELLIGATLRPSQA